MRLADRRFRRSLQTAGAVCLFGAGVLANASAQRSVITGRVVDRDGGTIPGATVRAVAEAGAPLTTTTRRDGTFSLDAERGPYVMVIELRGFHTRVLQQVMPGELRGDLALQIGGFSCDESMGWDRRVRVADVDGRPIPLALVSGGCEPCWTEPDGTCTVRVPRLAYTLWAAHVAFEPATIRSGSSGDTFTLARRRQTTIPKSAVPTVRVVTSWPAWTMELGGTEALVTRFLNDVAAHRFDGWMPEYAEGETAMVFTSRAGTWTMRIVPAASETAAAVRPPLECRLTLSGVEGSVRGLVIEGAVGPMFEAPVDSGDRRPAMLAITRVRSGERTRLDASGVGSERPRPTRMRRWAKSETCAGTLGGQRGAGGPHAVWR